MDTFDCAGNFRAADMTCSNYCCKERAALPECVSVAMAYVPFQQWNEIYAADKGLSVGTMFPCLNLPFVGCVR